MYTPCDLLKALINGCRAWLVMNVIIVSSSGQGKCTFDIEKSPHKRDLTQSNKRKSTSFIKTSSSSYWEGEREGEKPFFPIPYPFRRLQRRLTGTRQLKHKNLNKKTQKTIVKRQMLRGAP